MGTSRAPREVGQSYGELTNAWHGVQQARKRVIVAGSKLTEELLRRTPDEGVAPFPVPSYGGRVIVRIERTVNWKVLVYDGDIAGAIAMPKKLSASPDEHLPTRHMSPADIEPPSFFAMVETLAPVLADTVEVGEAAGGASEGLL